MSLTKQGAVGSGTELFNLRCSIHGLIHTAMVPSGIAGIERIFEMIWTKHVADSDNGKTVEQTLKEFYDGRYESTLPLGLNGVPDHLSQWIPPTIPEPDPMWDISVPKGIPKNYSEPKKPAEPKFTKPIPPWKNRKIIV